VPSIAKAYVLGMPMGYATPIAITDRAGKNLTDYAVKILLTSEWDGWSIVRSDGSDIYILNENLNPLYFWIESFDYTNKKALIWTKIPSLPANSTIKIYLVYGAGNPFINYRDPSNVFLYFNHFTSTFTFTTIGGSWVIDITGTGYLKSNNASADNWMYIPVSFSRPIAMGFLMEMGSSDAGGGFIWGTARGGESSVSGYIANYYTSTTYSELRKYSADTRTKLAGLPALSAGTWHRVELLLGSSKVIVVRNDAVDASATDTTFTTLSGIGFRVKNDIRRIDYVYVRPYADPDPFVSISSSIGLLRDFDTL